jgi:heat shock transcription factor
MYGFRKIPHVLQVNEIWEFAAPYFQQGRPDLLTFANRKKNRNKQQQQSSLDQLTMSMLLQEITDMKNQQQHITKELRGLIKEQKAIQRESSAIRERYEKHEQVMSKIINFMSILLSSNSHHHADTTTKYLNLQSFNNICTVNPTETRDAASRSSKNHTNDKH